MNTINATTIDHLTHFQGVNVLAALTGAQIVYNDEAMTVTMVFRKQVGTAGRKFTHLVVGYDNGRDLYSLFTYKLNKKTFVMTAIDELEGLYADQLRDQAERLTNLCLKF